MRYRSYKIIYPDPFTMRTSGAGSAQITIGSGIVKWPEKKENSEKESSD